jgi:DUF917 family protein
MTYKKKVSEFFFNLKGGEEILATTPNLIVVVESDSGVALQTEELKFGIRVSILVIPGKRKVP